MAEDMQPGPDAFEFAPQKAAAHMVSGHGSIENPVRRSVRDEYVDSGGDGPPASFEVFVATVEGPVVKPGRDRGTPEPQAGHGRFLVFKIDRVGDEGARQTWIVLEQKVVIAGHDHLVPVRERSQPGVESQDFLRAAGDAGIPGMHQDIPVRHDHPVVQFVGVGDTDNPHNPGAYPAAIREQSKINRKIARRADCWRMAGDSSPPRAEGGDRSAFVAGEIRLKPGREKSARARHPWIFDGALASVSMPEPEPGQVVRVRAAGGAALGYGFYRPGKTLLCALFAFGDAELEPDDAYWTGRLNEALAFRRAVNDSPEREAFRLVNGEGDELPGLVIDVYGARAVVQARTPGPDRILNAVESFLRQKLPVHEVYFFNKNGEIIRGPRTDSDLVFHDGGFAYHHRALGQKTGFFLDQSANRRLLETFARDREVLDLFCFTGGFTMHALRGGARRVVAVDESVDALDLLSRQVQANVPGADVRTVRENVPQFLTRLSADEFDCMVVDPPAFAKAKNAVAGAARGYKDLNLRALRKIRSGGLVFTFSCSRYVSADLFRKIVFGAGADAGRGVRVVQELQAAFDHPVSLFHPEGRYLKGLLLHVV